MLIRSLILVGALLLWSACRQDSVSAPPDRAPSPAPSVPAFSPSHSPSVAQPKLPTITLWIGTNQLTAEIARTPIQIQTGMMWRTNMAEMEGMLFVFPSASKVSFYMRNTLLPLSCAYIDSEGTILETYDMKPRDETSIPSKSDQVRYVLEVNQGWFQRHAVRAGMAVSTSHGSLAQTFFSR